MGMTKKSLFYVAVAAIAMWAAMPSPMAQDSGKASSAAVLKEPSGMGPGRALPEDAISADADRRAAAAMANTDAEATPTPMPIIRGNGNPYANSTKGGGAISGKTK